MPISPRSILFVHDYDPIEGGGGLVVNTLEVARVFAASGWKVSLATPEAKVDSVADGVSIVEIGDLNQLRAIVEAHQVVVVNLNFSMRPGALGTLQVCQMLRKPYFVWFRTTLKNLFFYRYAAQSRFEQETRLGELKTLLSSDLCQRVICVSQAVESDLSRFGVPRSKLAIVQDGIRVEGREVFNQPSLLSGEAGDLIFAGRLSLEKGPRYLVDATKILSARYPDIRVSIVGDGPEEGYLETLIKVLGLEGNIKLYGHLPNGGVLEFIRKHRVYCCCSLVESFGIAVVEAMLCGVPVVAPNIEGPQECLEEGRYGKLFELGNTKDLADKIASVLEDPIGSQEIARQARDYAQKEFSLERQFSELEELVVGDAALSEGFPNDLPSLSSFGI